MTWGLDSDITPMMENEMDKTMENEMEAEVQLRHILACPPGSTIPFK